MNALWNHRMFCIATFLLLISVCAADAGGYRAESGQIVPKFKSDFHVPKKFRFEPPWRQSGDCGPLSLYLLMRLEDRSVSVKDVENVLHFDPELGCSLADVARAAESLGFATDIRFVNPRDLPVVPFPYIIHGVGSLERGTGHFLVVVGYSPEMHAYSVIDTTYETFRYQSEQSVLQNFSGYVLLPINPFIVITESPFVSWSLVSVGGVLAGLTFLLYRVHSKNVSR